METILEIKECETSNGMGGFEVVTTKQSVRLFIDNRSSCCERFGYFWCNDDPNDFVGADLLAVTITDTALNDTHMKTNGVQLSHSFEGGVMFVNLETDQGVLQFVAYNEHNGYYGHVATVQCAQLAHSVTL